MKESKIVALLIIVVLLLFRIFLGIQINFGHPDYTQIYLMGLEFALSDQWSYWGADVVWSKTRLPGAMQGILGGVPIMLFKHQYSSIIASNIISGLGLIMLAYYAKKRFPKLSLNFLLILFLLLPLLVQHGVVLLNTSYLVFSGAILFISVFELFIYREKLIIKNPSYYFFIIGFSLFFTFQLHLTWVMYLPFIFVLLFFEWKRDAHTLWLSMLFLFAGGLISCFSLLPTIIKYSTVIFLDTSGNMAFKPERVMSIIDLVAKYFSFAVYDVSLDHNFYKLATEKSLLAHILLVMVKGFSLIQVAGLWITFYFVRKKPEFRKTFLLFILTAVMALFLFILSNKHLSTRTYILLYPIPIWMSLFAYDYLFKLSKVKAIMRGSLIIVFAAFIGVGVTNYNDKFSFKSVETNIEGAISNEDPYLFSPRRPTKMDIYK